MFNTKLMPITYNVAMENAHHEALITQAYKDAVGKWTWSIGLTSATGHNVERYINNPQTVRRCLEVYLWALDNYADHVRKMFPDGLSEARFAAVLSFLWNLGIGNLRKATWVEYYKKGDLVEAERRWKTWNKAGGKVNQGLVTRRNKECDLFFRGKWSHTGTITQFGVTSNNTPNWSSGKQINVDDIMYELLSIRPPVEIDTPPQPEVEQPVPTIGSDQEQEGKHAALIALVTSLLAALATFLATLEGD